MAALSALFQTPQRSIRPLWVLLTVLASTALVALLAGRWMQHKSLNEESLQTQRQLALYAQALEQRIDRYRALPDVLALDPELLAALSGPQTPATVRYLNEKLERANGASQASTLTLINQAGVAIAASNWRNSSSNVGEDYSFRPYVQQALQADRGAFYGIGVTTGEAGYFLSRGIHDSQDRIVGLIAIKIALQELEREWVRPPATVMAADAHGVVFLASDPQWRYHVLQPINAVAQREIDSTQQYGSLPLRPLRFTTRQTLAHGGMLADWQEPHAGLQLWQSTGLRESGWRLHMLHNVDSSRSAARWTALAAAGLWLALALLVLYVRQRQRLSRLRQRSRAELEALLQQHAQELRTAQDGIVLAARQADAGRSQSLEHLPQGVIVVDADLNLVAWNSRYMELFRLPHNLLQIGMPVQELYRYNARRGLLGKGPIEPAIERRMQYLRDGKPHSRESEKADGTVLEIRGNPLPGGGFVTSYADITSYKNAARELRSLADTLEKRVADRTHDLALAKREAEQANRYKSKFVAAAVHDLLQPLNAARMFASLLRQQVADEAAQQLASHVEGALAAQDDILNSLLDISRMESGQLQVHWADVAMQPLLQQLGNNLGVIASKHGLQLRVASCRAHVRSDEALLRRILQNFLSNAIRYTRQGKVLIGCRRVGRRLRIEVHDQGPGIPESLHGEIFEEFRRLETGHQHERGAGLGLAIVERLGKLLQHPIGLLSQLGHGSVFWVEVPLSAAEPAHPAPATDAAPGNAQAGPQQDSTVWYIAEAAEQQPVAQLLQRWGYRLATCSDAAQALQWARSASTPVAQLLLVEGDLQQPSAIAALLQACAKAPAVVWLSHQPDSPASQQARELGWQVLALPLRPAALRALVGQLLLRQR